VLIHYSNSLYLKKERLLDAFSTINTNSSISNDGQSNQTNSTNSTNDGQSNQTNSTNSTNDGQSNQTNSTNSTDNGQSNQTNSTNSTNNGQSNQTNSTNSSNILIVDEPSETVLEKEVPTEYILPQHQNKSHENHQFIVPINAIIKAASPIANKNIHPIINKDFPQTIKSIQNNIKPQNKIANSHDLPIALGAIPSTIKLPKQKIQNKVTYPTPFQNNLKSQNRVIISHPQSSSLSSNPSTIKLPEIKIQNKVTYSVFPQPLNNNNNLKINLETKSFIETNLSENLSDENQEIIKLTNEWKSRIFI